MLQRILTCLSFILLSLPIVRAQDFDLTRQYELLDKAISEYPQYLKQKEQHIAKLKQAAHQAANTQARIDALLKIYTVYQSFQKDSALVYINQCIKLANENRLYNQQARYQSLLAQLYSVIGSYSEALSVLRQVDRKALDNQGWQDYYYALNSVYQNRALVAQSTDKTLPAQYFAIADLYGDSLLQYASPQCAFALHRQEINLTLKHRYQEALRINDQQLNACKDDNRQFATVAFNRNLIYMAMNDKRNAKVWLIKSAIVDIKSAIMDQSALWTLADMLCEDKDVERANRYLRFSYQALSHFNAQTRYWQVSPVLDKIDSSYQILLAQNNLRLKTTLAIISIMALAMALFCHFIYRQKRLANKARNEAMELNRKLSELNHQLAESNQVKEEYIGQFLASCSHYIDLIEQQRLEVNRKLRKKQYAELSEMTSSSALKDEALDELYAHFDSAFLHLFPHFVEHLNGLLREDSQIKLPSDGRLTPTVRIFALIRLGIDDSNKIAEFLHYAVNTIYNYRAKLKNAAKGDRNTFEQEVKQLGLITKK